MPFFCRRGRGLILILALIVLTLLAFAAWLVATGGAIEGVVAGGGALVSGVAARFLVKQRSDARDTHTAAQEGLKKHSCPA